MTQWQPIETAPRDGTKVLLFFPRWKDGRVIGSYDVVEQFRNGKREFRTEKWSLPFFVVGEHEPTHWVPLPEPPT
jgi:hypothetical protein